MMAAKPEYIQTSGFIAEVIRTPRRKTATIKVDDRVVSVVVPQDLNEQRITRLLKDKNRWIKDKIAAQKAVAPARQKQFVSGEAFSYLGRNYRLKVKRGAYQPVKLLQGRLVATLPDGADNPHMVRNALVRWYQLQAEPKLREKTARLAKQIAVQPTAVNIKTYKSRWGNCNSKGQIDYNWKIVMAPHWVVDYVVVHELCHLKHFNHSKDYWRKVKHHCAEAVDAKEWLRVNSAVINI